MADEPKAKRQRIARTTSPELVQLVSLPLKLRVLILHFFTTAFWFTTIRVVCKQWRALPSPRRGDLVLKQWPPPREWQLLSSWRILFLVRLPATITQETYKDLKTQIAALPRKTPRRRFVKFLQHLRMAHCLQATAHPNRRIHLRWQGALDGRSGQWPRLVPLTFRRTIARPLSVHDEAFADRFLKKYWMI